MVKSLLSHTVLTCTRVMTFTLRTAHFLVITMLISKNWSVQSRSLSRDTTQWTTVLSSPSHLGQQVVHIHHIHFRYKRWVPQHQKHNQGLWECSRLWGLLGSVAGERLDSSIWALVTNIHASEQILSTNILMLRRCYLCTLKKQK